MNIYKYPKKSEWNKILSRPQIASEKLDKVVTSVLEDVKKHGDKAIKKYTEQFDKVKLNSMELTNEEVAEALISLDIKLLQAIDIAAKNIEKFHASQQTTVEVIETMAGVKCWQKPVAIEKVGLYIPGGTAPLFSTVLMLGIPAQVAGCKEIILCSPPNKEGKLHPAIIYAAYKTGIRKIFKVGGVQAIGAMAYGTETIPRAYKIFGPGNQYVTTAKQLVARDGVAIDLPAGPSEVAVVADVSSNPVFVASDLLAQAEHGTDSQVLLITKDENIIEPVLKEVDKQLEVLSRKEIANVSIKNSSVILVKDDEEIIEILNEYAPEHLILSIDNPMDIGNKIINAGSVFVGHYTPESAGDYASGTNHTLPTNGYAKSFSGVNLDSYVKKITFQEITKKGIKKIGPAIERMAQEEELTAHKNAVTVRLQNLD